MVFCLGPLFNLIRVVAFLPIKMVKIPNSNRIDFQYSKGFVLSSVIQGTLIVYSLYAENQHSDHEKQLLHTTFIYRLTFNCIFYVLHASPILYILQVKKKMKVLKEISDLALFLQKGTLTVRKRLISYFALVWSCYTAGSIINFFANELSFEYRIISLYFIEYLKFVITCAVIEFFEIVSDVKDCFYQLNVILPETFERCIAQETLWSSVPPIEVTLERKLADLDLSDLFELHRQLCCVVGKVNVIYGTQNLLAVVYIFLQLIFTTLTVLTLHARIQSWSFFLQGIAWVLILVILLYTLVRPCSHTVEEAKRTVAIVSKLMEKSVSEDFFKELEIYCRQLFLSKVEFSACGFFTLEIPLILSMLSIVTTYFTIILQLQTSESEKGHLTTTETSLALTHYSES